MVSVVVAAHNEAALLGRTLDAVLDDARPGEIEVVVAANGCTDRTADVARARPGVRVVESARPSKTDALNRADAVATRFPRIYLDADIPASTATIRALCAALAGPDAPLVAVPSRRLELAGRPMPVRAYYAVQQRLPAFEEGLFGRGLIALSRAGRERFTGFPEIIADDLFLDSLFTARERVCLPDVTTIVATPLRTRDLARRLVRVRRGNTALRAWKHAPGIVVRPADRLSWLTDVVARSPRLAPAAVWYVGLTAWAAVIAQRGTGAASWGRDESSRVAPAD